MQALTETPPAPLDPNAGVGMVLDGLGAITFWLDAGDLGVRSIQGITLGTTYVSGTLSLIAFNTKWRAPVAVVNVGTVAWPPQSPGVRLYNGTCLGFGYLATATTATTSSGSVWVMER